MWNLAEGQYSWHSVSKLFGKICGLAMHLSTCTCTVPIKPCPHKPELHTHPLICKNLKEKVTIKFRHWKTSSNWPCDKPGTPFFPRYLICCRLIRAPLIAYQLQKYFLTLRSPERIFLLTCLNPRCRLSDLSLFTSNWSSGLPEIVM
jgi:hypothetical protein